MLKPVTHCDGVEPLVAVESLQPGPDADRRPGSLPGHRDRPRVYLNPFRSPPATTGRDKKLARGATDVKQPPAR